MSMASPYACSDHELEPVARRQSNPDVLSAVIEELSSPPYTSIGRIWAMGKRWRKSERNTRITGPVHLVAMTRRPTCGRWSKPQYVSRTTRRASRPTGHPARHDV